MNKGLKENEISLDNKWNEIKNIIKYDEVEDELSKDKNQIGRFITLILRIYPKNNDKK